MREIDEIVTGTIQVATMAILFGIGLFVVKGLAQSEIITTEGFAVFKAFGVVSLSYVFVPIILKLLRLIKTIF